MKKLNFPKGVKAGLYFTSFVFISFFILSQCSKTLVLFDLTNKTSDEISFCEVAIKGDFIRFEHMAPGKTVSGHFIVRGDDDYKIVCKTNKGGNIEARLGYITSGMESYHHFDVNEGEIVLSKVTYPATK